MQPSKRNPNQLFGNQVRYEIPDYQRPYVWTEESQWEPLWTDVASLADDKLKNSDEKKVPHFLGAVVLNQHPNPAGSLEKREVVDGQQRLITLQILIRAVTSAMNRHDFGACVAKLNSLSFNPDAFWDGEEDNRFKVWPSLQDRESLRKVLSANDDIQIRRDDGLITRAYHFFYVRAREWLDENDNTEEAGVALESTLRTQLELVIIDLAEDDDANLIFETMNARGTPLRESDKIKNRISYELIPLGQELVWKFDESQESTDFWYENTGTGHNQRPRLDQLINYWLTLRNTKTIKVRSEFTEFVQFSNYQRSLNRNMEYVLNDLYLIAEKFKFIQNGNASALIKFDGVKRLAHFLKVLDVLAIGAVTPVLLYLIEKCVNQRQLDASLLSLESYLVRRWICGMSTRSYNENFVTLMQKLSQASFGENFVGTIIDHLADNPTNARLWPNDTMLGDTFRERALYSTRNVRRLNYVLRRIEDQLRGGGAEELISESLSDLQIEHIMPVEWRENWSMSYDSGANSETKELLDERRDHVIHTIGNLTLLTTKLNVEVSNGPWDLKRRSLSEQSVLKLNYHLYNDTDAEVWDEKKIAERSEGLFDLCKEIWPFGHNIDT